MKKQIFKALLPATLIVTIFCTPLFGQEDCRNSIDDDADGLIDLNDDDCVCTYSFQNNTPTSIIPNPSFEEMNCCPTGFSDMHCATTWIQASDATSDYIHPCSFFPSSVPTPIPDGDGCVGFHSMHNYKEYIGACLIEPIISGEQYTLQMDIAASEVSSSLNLSGPPQQEPLYITVYGSPNCNDIPYNGYLCPMNSAGDWQVIGEYLYEPNQIWSTIDITLEATEDINVVVIGAPCDLPVSYPALGSSLKDYFFIDNLILNASAFFSAQIEDNYYTVESNGDLIELDNQLIDNNPFYGQYCFDELVLNSSVDSLDDYQWYHNGIAIANATSDSLVIDFDEYQEGTYSFVIFQDSVCSEIEVVGNLPLYPQAGMTVSDICIPDDGNLMSIPDGMTNIVEHKWIVDGQYEYAGPTVNHYFEGHSVFNVKHIVQAENLCTDTIEEFIEMPAFPEVGFYVEDVCENELIEALDSSFVNFGGNIVDWNWNLSAGPTTSQDQNPNFTVNNFGVYTLSLEVETDQGCLGFAEQNVEVHPLPDAHFSLTPICFSDPLAFFNNESTIAQGTMNFLWQSGDGTALNEENPLHLYTAPGVFDVSLLATSDFGCKDSMQLAQIVSEVIANFDYGITAGCHPHQINLTSTSSSSEGSLDQFRWIYSNGDTIFADQDFPTFTNFGHEEIKHYDISLLVIDEYGCRDSIAVNQLIEVWPRPLAQFSFSIDDSNQQYQKIQFENQSIGGKFFDWQMGNGTFSQEEHPFSFYPDDETYAIEMITETDYGCLDTANALIDIEAANYVYIPNSFSPNADGFNDLFMPSINGPVVSYTVEVYDRWGQLVFKSDEVGQGWNGSYPNTEDYYTMSGIYTFQVIVKFANEAQANKHRGMVTLIR